MPNLPYYKFFQIFMTAKSQFTILGPVDFGVPVLRPRKFTVGILRSFGYFKHNLHRKTFGVTWHFRLLRLNGDSTFTAPQDR